MPIIVRRDRPGDLLTLAKEAGAAEGNAQRQQRQHEMDQQFLYRALERHTGQSHGTYGSHPGDFGYTGDEAAEGGGYGRGRRGRDEDQTGVQTFVNEDARATASADEAIRNEAAQARIAAQKTAEKRAMFAAASQQGPEALAQFLAADSFATQGKVPEGLVDKLAPDAGAGGASGGSKPAAARTSQFQNDASAAVQGGNLGALEYLNEKKAAAYDPSAPPGSPPVQVPTDKSIEATNALASVATAMAPAALKNLRAQIASGPISDAAKSKALAVVDQQLSQKQKMRDVEIAQVYDDVIAKATRAINAARPGAPMPSRDQQRRAVGTKALEIAKQYGIDPGEFVDWVSRQNSAMNAAHDQARMAPAGSAPAGANGPNAAPAPAGGR